MKDNLKGGELIEIIHKPYVLMLRALILFYISGIFSLAYTQECPTGTNYIPFLGNDSMCVPVNFYAINQSAQKVCN